MDKHQVLLEINQQSFGDFKDGWLIITRDLGMRASEELNGL
jgi:hypothetical protein